MLLDESYFNLDGSERGEAKIMKKIFGKISDLKIIFVNMSEFISKIKTEEKIDYLCGLGEFLFLNLDKN